MYILNQLYLAVAIFYAHLLGLVCGNNSHADHKDDLLEISTE